MINAISFMFLFLRNDLVHTTLRAYPMFQFEVLAKAETYART